MITAKSLAFWGVPLVILLNLVVLADVLAQGSAPSFEAPRTDLVVQRFYDAINTAIATGDENALLEVTSAGYFEEDPLPGFSSDRSGLLQRVKTLRQLDSGLRLAIAHVETSGSMASVSIAVQGGSSTLATLNRSALWRSTDLLSVSGSVVRERRGAGPEIVVMTSDCALEIPRANADVAVRFTRLQLQPRMSTRVPASAGDGGLIMVSGDAMLVNQPKNSTMSQSGAGLVDIPRSIILSGEPGTQRIIAGESGATLLLITQHSLSPLGGPGQDLSAFDPAVAISAARPELISYGSSSLELRCSGLLVLPGARVQLPVGESDVAVADPSLERCAIEESGSALTRRYHNCHSGPLLVTIAEVMTEETDASRTSGRQGTSEPLAVPQPDSRASRSVTSPGTRDIAAQSPAHPRQRPNQEPAPAHHSDALAIMPEEERVLPNGGSP